ncbi:MAG: transglycosylase domain-containing protein [Micrococcales bacterium]
MSGGKKRETVFSAILKFTGLSAIAGVVAVALAAPTLLIGSVVTNAGIAVFENLPSYIKPVNASQASTLWALKDGQQVKVAEFYDENRISVGYNDMSPNIRNAVVSTEDPRFFQHGGVDVVSLVRATLTNVLMGGGGPGGSTITMQYVKNSLIEAATLSGDQAAIDAARAQTIDRKLKEIRLAIALEQVATKQEILAGYLNLSFFGGQINGIESAAEYYYGVKAADLSIPQAAMLAAMLKSPNDYRPDIAANQARAKNRRDYVIDNMQREGYITSQQASEAKATPVTVNVTNVPGGCEGNQVTSFFCDYVVWTIRNSPEFGPTQADREQLLRRGGLDIYSTMDLSVQQVAHDATMKWVPSDNPDRIGSASVSVQVGTGRILGMTENRIYDQTTSTDPSHTSVNYSSDVNYGGSHGFQVGSTYKIFTLADWLTSGRKLLDHVDGRVRTWNSNDFSSRCGVWDGTWAPNNITPEPEDVTVVQATSMSINTAYASMAHQLDLCDIRDTAMAFGVHRADLQPLIYTPSSIIGVNEIAPLTMAAAEAGVSNKGMYCSPIAIDRVVTRVNGQEIQVPKSVCTQAVTPEVAAGMTYAMQRVISGGTGGASSTGDNTPLAGKTGTTDSGVHTWMTGFSSAVATATWVGNVSGSVTLSGIKLNNKAGNTVRHDVWRTIMQTVNKLYPGSALQAPPQTMIDATYVTIPAVSSKLPSDAQAAIEAGDLNAKVIVGQVASSSPAGTVAYTRPVAGKSVPRGTQIHIYVSKGGASTVPAVTGMTVAAAKAALLAAGFAAVTEPQPSQTQYFVHSSTVAKGLVVGTDPAAGTPAAGNGAILLIISLGP